MKISRERLEAALMPHLKRCPKCGTDKHWLVDDNILPLVHRQLEGGTIVANIQKPDFIPLLVLSCPECGYTEFFNAKVLGLLE